MALILCGREAEIPYYYERLDLSVYSLEELGYALGHYLILVPDHFVNPELCRWLSEALGEKELGEKLLQLLEMGEKEERLIFRLIRESSYYTEKEVEELSQEWRRIHALSEAERREKMGDSFFSLGKYKKAVDAYQDALHFEENAIFKPRNFSVRRRAIEGSMKKTTIRWRQEGCIFCPKCAFRRISTKVRSRTWKKDLRKSGKRNGRKA